ncbi:conserved hypothetical protein [Flavobacterium sp. 9AF]|uniref:hypothetical protein n=1 Tax=Flavobacterium sp. 9AF TaxID=2653142 RepID=UPI0012EF4277|nr:hypothetical protein [Flavobacterium sp. 9AF]VXC14720.1 conserved hypothetical protein [Flavobacterium sp. 9AF]
MKNLVYILFVLLLHSCNNVKEKTKETINKTGETVGKSATEFFDGVSDGVKKTLDCEITLSQDLIKKGLQTGKYEIKSKSNDDNDNTLILYLIFNDNFKQTLNLKAFDKENIEIGRSNLEVSGKKGSAEYFEFYFNDKTDIESKSKITIE